jgi:hypothetical protein
MMAATMMCLLPQMSAGSSHNQIHTPNNPPPASLAARTRTVDEMIEEKKRGLPKDMPQWCAHSPVSGRTLVVQGDHVVAAAAAAAVA